MKYTVKFIRTLSAANGGGVLSELLSGAVGEYLGRLAVAMVDQVAEHQPVGGGGGKGRVYGKGRVCVCVCARVECYIRSMTVLLVKAGLPRPLTIAHCKLLYGLPYLLLHLLHTYTHTERERERAGSW